MSNNKKNTVLGEYQELTNPDIDKIKHILDTAYETDAIAKNKWRIENRKQLRQQRKIELKQLMEKPKNYFQSGMKKRWNKLLNWLIPTRREKQLTKIMRDAEKMGLYEQIEENKIFTGSLKGIPLARRKALDIVRKFYYILPNNGSPNTGLNSCESRYREAISCGLISVDLLLEYLRDIPSSCEGLEGVKSEMTRMQMENRGAILNELC